MEVPKTKHMQKYHTKLMNAMEYQNILHKGPTSGQPVEDFTWELSRCFKITNEGERARLLEVYYQKHEAAAESLEPM
ncbi:MAG: hypothetical protein GY820_21945, partial [Gammaproteobacteria bacterium]|nr:hypothetical protein [Gammaproteobacteria bacterium]